MSRENRRKAAAAGQATATAERPSWCAHSQTSEPAPPQRVVSWRHCLIGLIVGELILLILSDGGLALANATMGSDGRDKLDGGIVGVASFLAVLAGGYL